jgi:hypothetical protein
VDLMRACQRENLFRIERDRQGVMRIFPGNVMQAVSEPDTLDTDAAEESDQQDFLGAAAEPSDTSEESATESWRPDPGNTAEGWRPDPGNTAESWRPEAPNGAEPWVPDAPTPAEPWRPEPGNTVESWQPDGGGAAEPDVVEGAVLQERDDPPPVIDVEAEPVEPPVPSRRRKPRPAPRAQGTRKSTETAGGTRARKTPSRARSPQARPRKEPPAE